MLVESIENFGRVSNKFANLRAKPAMRSFRKFIAKIGKMAYFHSGYNILIRNQALFSVTIMFSYKVDAHSELRMLEERHAELLFVLVEQNRERHPEIPQLYSLEDARMYIKRDLALFAENKGLGIGIWFQGNLAGAIRYHEIDWTNRSTELGYWLGAAYEGKGLVTTACQVLIERAFSELGLNRVVISCAPENRRSRAIAEKLSFTQESILRQSDWLKDRFVDQVVYGILASEWQSRK